MDPVVLVLLIVALVLVLQYHRASRRLDALSRLAAIACKVRDEQIDRLLTVIGDMGVEAARLDMARAAWMSYALGYEVYCEAVYDGDQAGIRNAGIAIAAARARLQALGEYDA